MKKIVSLHSYPMFRKASKLLLGLFAMALYLQTLPLGWATDVSIPEEVEWTWYARPAHIEMRLPNVLLLGDSISRNYYPRVTERLKGIANVYLLATSASVGDPRLITQIADFEKLESVPFAVVHFNNGMHGWAYSEAAYKAQFTSFLQAVCRINRGRAALIWASTTPVKQDKSGGASNARIVERNAIALAAMQDKKILLDDQHTLMLRYQDLYADSVHFNEEGSSVQGDQAADQILRMFKTNP